LAKRDIFISKEEEEPSTDHEQLK